MKLEFPGEPQPKEQPEEQPEEQPKEQPNKEQAEADNKKEKGMGLQVSAEMLLHLTFLCTTINI